MITKAELIADGCVPNINMWIGDGWFYCRTCEAYQFHGPWSHKGEADCYEICKVCDTYTGNLHLKGSSVTTAADILEAADAKRRIQGHDPRSIPTRVFVLLQSGTVLGVLTNEQRALDEAGSLMAASVLRVGAWETLALDRIWRASDGTIIEVSAHDVR